MSPTHREMLDNIFKLEQNINFITVLFTDRLISYSNFVFFLLHLIWPFKFLSLNSVIAARLTDRDELHLNNYLLPIDLCFVSFSFFFQNWNIFIESIYIDFEHVRHCRYVFVSVICGSQYLIKRQDYIELMKLIAYSQHVLFPCRFYILLCLWICTFLLTR